MKSKVQLLIDDLKKTFGDKLTVSQLKETKKMKQYSKDCTKFLKAKEKQQKESERWLKKNPMIFRKSLKQTR